MLRGMLEKRYHPQEDPPNWLRKTALWGGWETDAGIDVNPNTAMQVTAWLACIRIISETVASLPYITYRRLSRGKERAPEHYLYPILHDIANSEMSAFTFRALLSAHMLTRGNGIAEIEFNKGGGINALWPLDPDSAYLWRDPDTKKLFYIYRLPLSVGGNQVKLPAERIFHIKWMSHNGLWGLSPTYLARQSLGLALAVQTHGAKYFSNGAEPGVVLSHPGELDDKSYERLQGDWEEMHQGLEKSHRVAILEEGMTIEKLTATNEDAQFIQTKSMTIADIGRIFNVSLDMLNETDKAATYASVEQFGIRFSTLTLRPYTVRWEQETNRSLLAPSERRTYYSEHLMDALMRGDSTSRFQVYTAGFQTGAYSPNDIREKENDNPVDGGDQHFVPLNMVPVDQAGPPTPASTSSTRSAGERQTGGESAEQRSVRSAGGRRRLATAQRRIFRDAAARVLKREAQDILAAAQKAFGVRSRRDAQAFNAWLDAFYRDQKAFVEKQFAPSMQAYAQMVAAAAGDEVNTDVGLDQIEHFVQAYIAAFAARHVGVGLAQVRKMVDAALLTDDPMGALERDLADWQDTRASETADWESNRESNAVAKVVYGLAGFAAIRWVASGKTCPYCSSLDGTIVSIDKVFIQAGHDFKPDGADGALKPSFDVGHPPAHDGCDCMITAWN